MSNLNNSEGYVAKIGIFDTAAGTAATAAAVAIAAEAVAVAVTAIADQAAVIVVRAAEVAAAEVVAERYSASDNFVAAKDLAAGVAERCRWADYSAMIRTAVADTDLHKLNVNVLLPCLQWDEASFPLQIAISHRLARGAGKSRLHPKDEVQNHLQLG